MPQSPLPADAIEARLDEALDPVLSSRRTATGLARALAECERAQLDDVKKLPIKISDIYRRLTL